MKRALTGLLVAAALTGSAVAGTFSNGLERLTAGKPANEAITVLLSMADQADIATLDAALRVRQATLAERHQLVVGTLMSKATASQAELVAELATLKAAGKVRGYTPYWINNSVVVNAPIAVLRQLAARSDVAVAEPNLQVEAILPIVPGEAL